MSRSPNSLDKCIKDFGFDDACGCHGDDRLAQTIADGMENHKPKISTAMVRAMTLLAMQPMAKGVRVEEFELEALLVKGYLEIFMENTYF